MTLKQLLKKIDKSYPDGLVKGAEKGDTLATFIVSELEETFEPKATNLHKLSRAHRVMRTVAQDVLGVRSALSKLHHDAIQADIEKEKEKCSKKK